MKHVVCLIHRDHLTIERNGAAIGNVYELYGEPTIQLNNASPNQVVQLTQNDCEIIWDNWHVMKELGSTIQKVVDLLPHGSKLSV
jgi:hypothetical protein